MITLSNLNKIDQVTIGNNELPSGKNENEHIVDDTEKSTCITTISPTPVCSFKS